MTHIVADERWTYVHLMKKSKLKMSKMTDPSMKIMQTGKVFSGEVYKPNTFIPLYLKLNKVNGKDITPGTLYRYDIEIFVKELVSTYSQ